MVEVWIGWWRCGLDSGGVDWMAEVWIGWWRCGLDGGGVDLSIVKQLMLLCRWSDGLLWTENLFSSTYVL